ncbi:MAG: DegT/DnrJ/EryC1/StrS family aminotransferase [bacterium]|nr:DegT/DnrJ/EryC1/StrS family aminotransferase [bacterium]
MKILFNPITTKLEQPTSSKIAVFGDIEDDITYTFSGKSALAMLLHYYRSAGVLRDRTDEILVPQWLGIPVYESIHKFCFPTTSYNDRVRGVLAYHQWGYPQHMDTLKKFCKGKGLFLIEDCAHSFESWFNGQRLGTFGDAAIFSLAKFFPSVMGGATYTTDATIRTFVARAIGNDDPILAKEFFDTRLAFDREPTDRHRVELEKSYIVYNRALKCPEYSLAVARKETSDGAMDMRKRHYTRYAKAFGSEEHLSELLKEQVVPWVVPLFFDEETCKSVAVALQSEGIEADVYHFDVNRNMLNPNFVPCVPVPCHQKMSDEEVDRVITIVKALS